MWDCVRCVGMCLLTCASCRCNRVPSALRVDGGHRSQHRGSDSRVCVRASVQTECVIGGAGLCGSARILCVARAVPVGPVRHLCGGGSICGSATWKASQCFS